MGLYIITGVCKWLAAEKQVIRMSGVTTVTEATEPYIQPEVQRRIISVHPEEVRLMTEIGRPVRAAESMARTGRQVREVRLMTEIGQPVRAAELMTRAGETTPMMDSSRPDREPGQRDRRAQDREQDQRGDPILHAEEIPHGIAADQRNGIPVTHRRHRPMIRYISRREGKSLRQSSSVWLPREESI